MCTTVESGGEELRLAEEGGKNPGPRPLVDLLGDADLLDRPAVENGNSIGHRHGLFLVVRDVHERGADLAVDLGQLDLEPLAKLEVERSERLVEQQNSGPPHECARYGDALLLTAGELSGQAVAELLPTDQLEGLGDASRGLLLVHPRHPEAEGHVLTHDHVREERVRLEDRVDVPLVRRLPVDALSLDPDRARRRRDEAADEVQRCRLPTARGTKQAEELAVADLELGGLERRLMAVLLRDAAELDAWHGRGPCDCAGLPVPVYSEWLGHRFEVANATTAPAPASPGRRQLVPPARGSACPPRASRSAGPRPLRPRSRSSGSRRRPVRRRSRTRRNGAGHPAAVAGRDARALRR